MTGLDVDLHGAVGDLSIDVAFRAGGEVPLVIVGPNGAGKTSALMMILGGLPPRRGRVVLHGEALFDHDRGVDVPVEQRRIGYLPQRYALFPHLDVLGNVAYGVRAGSRDERRHHAREALRELDAAALAARRPAELSGGEMQRVALARALASRPHALLMDEPMAALDVSIRRDVRAFLSTRVRALGLPTVVVTHDLADAAALQGDMVVIEGGAITQAGRLSALAAAPATDFVRRFVAGPGHGP
ncbi:MAG: ATP-binding cassette domain-containing protein [Bacteroidota bacterium]